MSISTEHIRKAEENGKSSAAPCWTSYEVFDDDLGRYKGEWITVGGMTKRERIAAQVALATRATRHTSHNMRSKLPTLF